MGRAANIARSASGGVIGMNWKNRLFRTAGYLIGSVIVLTGLEAGRRVLLLKARGVSAVVEAMSNHTTRRGRRSWTTVHYATVTFTTARGEKITKNGRVPAEAFDDFNRHVPVTLHHGAANPRDFAFDRDGTPWGRVMLGFVIIAGGWAYGQSRR